jgi:sulfotransferase
MICCVRDISWIIDSVERLTRRNLFDLSAIFDYEPGHTVYTRAERLVAPDGLVGSALSSLREGYYGEQSDRMLIIDYEALVRNAEEAVAKVYMFLGEEPFKHTFENLEYDVPEYDASIGTPNLHTVRPKVEWVERKTILPPDLFERFAEQSFWKYLEQNRNDVPVILHGS